MPQLKTIAPANTEVIRTPDTLEVRYYDTTIVKVERTKITLDTDRWMTVSTKNQMNRASNQFNLGYNVYRNMGDWWVIDAQGYKFPFLDGKVSIDYDGGMFHEHLPENVKPV